MSSFLRAPRRFTPRFLARYLSSGTVISRSGFGMVFCSCLPKKTTKSVAARPDRSVRTIALGFSGPLGSESIGMTGVPVLRAAPLLSALGRRASAAGPPKTAAAPSPDKLGLARAGMFIDADNVGPRCAEKALSAARDRGVANLCCVRAYKDWNKEPAGSDFVRACDRLGIEQVHVSRAAGKNSSDIRMCVDIMKMLLSGDMHRFILVTSDSDFRHVLLEIRGMGAVGSVYHGGRDRNRWLAGYADEYVVLDADEKKGV